MSRQWRLRGTDAAGKTVHESVHDSDAELDYAMRDLEGQAEIRKIQVDSLGLATTTAGSNP